MTNMNTQSTGPGSAAWEEFWDTVEMDRDYLSDGYNPTRVAYAAEALGAIAVTQES